MQYDTFELEEESQELCVIITPYGKYKHKCLSIGLKCTPDIGQQVMEQVLCRINNIEVCLDDIGIFQNPESHLMVIEKVLSCLD